MNSWRGGLDRQGMPSPAVRAIRWTWSGLKDVLEALGRLGCVERGPLRQTGCCCSSGEQFALLLLNTTAPDYTAKPGIFTLTRT